MKSHTSLVAQQTRLSEWADLIRDCQNRPQGMKIDEWYHCTTLQKRIITRDSEKPVRITWKLIPILQVQNTYCSFNFYHIFLIHLELLVHNWLQATQNQLQVLQVYL